METNEINKFCGFCDDAFSTLLDAYQVKDWGMSWPMFVARACIEFTCSVNNWFTYKIGEDENGNESY